METEGVVKHSQKSATSPYLSLGKFSPSPHPTSLSPMLMLFSHLILGLPSGLCSSAFPTKTLHASSLSTIRAIRPARLIILHFYLPNNIWCDIQIAQLLVIPSFPLLFYLILVTYRYVSQDNNLLNLSVCFPLSVTDKVPYFNYQ